MPRIRPLTLMACMATALLVTLLVPRAMAAYSGPHVKISSPKKKANVKSPVTVIAQVEEFKLVPAGTMLAEGEGHLHFFIDVPADNVKPGAMIPLDTLARYVHLGKEPFDRRDLTLAPGKHTITVVAANSAHQRIAGIKPHSVTFRVSK